MAIHSSVLAWRIPGTGEPGGLPSLGSHRVGHDWSDLAAAAAAVEFIDLIRLNFKLGFPGGLEGKASACSAGDLGWIPESGRSPGEGNGNPLCSLAWKIPWTEEPDRLQSMELQWVGHDWVTSLSLSLSLGLLSSKLEFLNLHQEYNYGPECRK